MQPGIIFPKLPSFDVGTLIDTQTFDTPGAASWTKKHGGRYAIIEIWAGGGSGGHAYNGDTEGQGGQGGSYKRYKVDLQWLAETESLLVGAGAAATVSNGNSGLAGGFSHFAAAIWAKGGYGGRGQFTTLVAASDYTPTDVRDTAMWVLELAETGGASGLNVAGSNATYAGAGGGGVRNTSGGTKAGGTSVYGGNGGVSQVGGVGAANNGAAPAGGGGADIGEPYPSGSGGAGRVKVSVYA